MSITQTGTQIGRRFWKCYTHVLYDPTLHCCSEMAKASEDLAGNNCAASQELVQLREDKASQAQDLELLQVLY